MRAIYDKDKGNDFNPPQNFLPSKFMTFDTLKGDTMNEVQPDPELDELIQQVISMPMPEVRPYHRDKRANKPEFNRKVKQRRIKAKAAKQSRKKNHQRRK